MERNVSRISLLLLAMLLVAGCGPKPTPESTPIPLPTLTSTPIPTVTDAPTPMPTLQPTPTDQTGCTDKAEFVADVTIPDDTTFGPGQAFVKTWRIKNAGTCIWNMRYNLFYLRGEQMDAPARVSFGELEAEPGQTIDVSVNLVAPLQAGTYTGSFQFENPAGTRFGVKDGNIWVKIIVGGSGTVPVTGTTPTVSGTAGTCVFGLNADFVNQVLNLINQARVTNGLSPLTVNPMLTASAQAHSQDMACNNFINHRGSDGSTEASRIAAQGYVSSRDDEVIYAAFPDGGGDPASVVNWWLNDASHRPVLLAADFTEFGGGYAFVSTSGAGGYFTVDFAVP